MRYMFLFVKICGSKYNFCDLVWLIENFGVISTLENTRTTEMNN